MLGTARKGSAVTSAGCWRHTAVVGEMSCDRCGTRCCEQCWLEAPHGSLCIECALEFAGVRAPRRRVHAGRAVAPERSPLATLSWERSADLIDLAPAYRRKRREPVERDLFVRAA
jgi:hypothetical protein